jgi:hypothetical protein
MKGWLLIILQIVAVFFVSCDEDHDQQLRVSTIEISAITEHGAQSGSTIISQGSEEILQQGVCWSTLPDPTTEDSLTVASPGSEFAIALAELKPKTTYYVRAFARTGSTTVYGNEVSFTTLGYDDWETFDTSNSALPSNIISEITVDKNGVAWLRVENYLVRFDGESFTNYRFAEQVPLDNSILTDIYVDVHDNKWLNSATGLYKFDNTNFEKFETVRGFFVEKDTLWTVRANQLEKMQISTGASISCTVPYVDGHRDDVFYELKKDLKGRYLAGLPGYHYGTYIQMSESDFCSTKNIGLDIPESYSKLTVSPDSLIYVTSSDYGFGIIKKDLSFEFVNSGNSALPADYTLDIAVEGHGSSVWIAYTYFWWAPPQADHSSGLVEYSPTRGVVNVYNTLNSGIVSDYVRCVAVMNNKILVGTYEGLSVYTQ